MNTNIKDLGDAFANFVENGNAVILFAFATATERLLGKWDEFVRFNCHSIAHKQTQILRVYCAEPRPNTV